jgi:gamma-glutamylcyclotransferase (GGCT)/AIG2-like uncharacterized protein YtfP
MRFFFYGTLMASGGNPVPKRVHAELRALGPAVATGRLFAIPTGQGWYPALLTDPEGSAVHGAAYEALPSFTAEHHALLDDYEAFYPDRPEESEYLREQIAILCGGREERAEAYVYRAALVSGARPVPLGDFNAFLAETGLPPYRISAGEIGSALAPPRQG